MPNMPGGLTVIMCVFKRLREKKTADDGHSAGNKLSVFQQVLSQARSYPQDNVCHAGKRQVVYCHTGDNSGDTSDIGNSGDVSWENSVNMFVYIVVGYKG